MCVIGSLRSHILDKIGVSKRNNNSFLVLLLMAMVIIMIMIMIMLLFLLLLLLFLVVVLISGSVHHIIAIMCHLQKIQNTKYSPNP